MQNSLPSFVHVCQIFSSVSFAQDAVEELATDPPAITEYLCPLLRDMKDLDPAVASLHHRKIKPSRLLSLLGIMRKVDPTPRACRSLVSTRWNGVSSRPCSIDCLPACLPACLRELFPLLSAWLCGCPPTRPASLLPPS